MVTTRAELVASRRQRPGMPRNILRCPGQPPTQRLSTQMSAVCRWRIPDLEGAPPPHPMAIAAPLFQGRPPPARVSSRPFTYFAVSEPQREDEVPQSQVHGGVSGILRELIELVQLHHVWPHAQGFTALVGLIERLEVPVHAWS